MYFLFHPGIVPVPHDEGDVSLGGVVDDVAVGDVLPCPLQRLQVLQQLLRALDGRLAVEEREVVLAGSRDLYESMMQE